MNKKIYCSALCALFGGMLLTSCTNELREPSVNVGDGLKLAKAPQVTAWSGNHTFNNTRANDDLSVIAPGLANAITSNNAPKTRGEMDPDNSYSMNKDGKIFWKEARTNLLNLDEEAKIIKDWLPEGTMSPYADKLKLDFMYYAKNSDIEFEFYPVYGETAENHSIGLFYFNDIIDPSPVKTDDLWEDFVMVYNPGGWNHNVPLEDGYMPGYKIKIKAGTYFGFYWINNGKNGEPGVQYAWQNPENYENININESFSHKSLNKPNAWSNGCNIPGWSSEVRAVTFYKDGKTYIGFEDSNDYDFNDIVFTADKILLMVDSEGKEYELPEDYEEPSNPKCPKDNCGHDKHDGDICQDCVNEGKHSACNPCPKEDEGGNNGCGHPGSSHDPETGICQDCVEKGTNGPCNPETGTTDPEDPETPNCPNVDNPDFNGGCTHDHDDTYCDDCDDENGNCKHPEATNPCPNAGKDGYPEDGCGHEHRGKYCPTCEEGEPCHRPESKDLADGGTEVEVNLSINDKHEQYNGIEDFVTKLSIHVRYPHDVKVTIPIPAGMYIDKDDLLIFNKHEEIGVQQLPPHQAKFVIGDTEVYLTVEYSEDAITITTSGINDEVFEYCVDEYGDGLNFEIYNYFIGRVYENGEWKTGGVELSVLQGMLNQSTIEFIDEAGTTLSMEECPNYYINAFGKRDQWNYNGPEPEGGYDPLVDSDNIVSIVEDQEGFYDNGLTGSHLNGSDSNVIYKKDGVENTNENNEHGHTFLWGEDE